MHTIRFSSMIIIGYRFDFNKITQSRIHTLYFTNSKLYQNSNYDYSSFHNFVEALGNSKLKTSLRKIVIESSSYHDVEMERITAAVKAYLDAIIVFR